MSRKPVVVCQVHIGGQRHRVAIPLRWVKEVVPPDRAEGMSGPSWEKASDTPAPARWFLVLNTTPEQAWPVQDVTPPRGVPEHHMYRVPTILTGWARRLGVDRLLWDEPHLVPIIVPGAINPYPSRE